MYGVFEQLLQERGVTPYRVSKATGVSQTTLSRWKSTGADPNRSALAKIADFFDVTVDYLITGETNEGYYLDKKTALKAQEAYVKNRVLFDAAEGSRPEDIQMAVDLLNRLKQTNTEE